MRGWCMTRRYCGLCVMLLNVGCTDKLCTLWAQKRRILSLGPSTFVTITRVQLRVWPRNDISGSILDVGSMFCRKLWYNTFFHVFIFGFRCYPSMHRFIVVIKSASLYIDFENDLNSTKREQCFFLNSFLPIIQLDQMNTDLKKMSLV